MGRLLILGAVIGIAIYLIKKLFLEKPSIQSTEAPLMKKCAHCDMHIPEDQGHTSNGLFFCNEEHRDLFLKP